MAPISDHQDDMDEIFSDGVVEDVLSGRLVTDELAGEVGAVVADLRLLATAPAPEVAGRHLAAMMAASAAIGTARSPRRARRSLRSLSPRWAASLGLAGALSLTGGLAAAGALPAPAQHVVSRVAHDLGINVPMGDATRDPASNTSTTTVTADEHQGGTGSNSGSGGPKVTVPTSKSDHQSGRHGAGHDSGHDRTETTGGETENTQPDASGRDTHRGGTSTTPTTSSTPTTAPSGGGGGGGNGGGNGGGGGK